MGGFWTRFQRGFKVWVSWPVPAAILVYVLIVWQLSTDISWRGLDEPRFFLMILEVFLPALVPVLAGGLFPVEQENGTMELLLSYPVGRATLLLDKFALLASVVAPVLIGTLLYARAQVGGRLPVDVMLGTALPTIWFLAAATVLASILGGGALAGTLFGMGYWAFEMLTKGSVTKHAFLFGRTYGLQVRGWVAGMAFQAGGAADAAARASAAALLQNKLLLVALGLAAAAASWVLLAKARVPMGGDGA